MTYPAVMSEDETLDAAIGGRSLARYGDGELRLCIGGTAKAQRQQSKKLTNELCEILAKPVPSLLPCIPNLDQRSPNIKTWTEVYATNKYVSLYKLPLYGSAFITRPDSAPWINRPDYWAKVKQLWHGKDITFVRGDTKSLTPTMMAEAASIRIVDGPPTEAYAHIDRIEADVGNPSGPVLICLGPTATVLAARLARKGIHAIDLGHIGQFMRRLDINTDFTVDDLASGSYRKQLIKKHSQIRWGSSGHSHAPEIIPFAKELGAETVLDYGCGSGTLKRALPGFDVREYDPGIIGKDKLPQQADLLVATDVLEHIEQDKLDAVLAHFRKLARLGLFLTIATRPAREILPDGRNAHLLVKTPDWWLGQLKSAALVPIRVERRKSLTLWIKRYEQERSSDDNEDHGRG